MRRAARVGAVAIFVAVVAVWAPVRSATAAGTADEIHYTFTGQTSVAFDWRGTATDIRYGPTTTTAQTATAHAPTPTPFSSAGPFQEVELTGLRPGTRYHYSIGGGPDHTFDDRADGNFRFDAIGDVGSSPIPERRRRRRTRSPATSRRSCSWSGDLPTRIPGARPPSTSTSTT